MGTLKKKYETNILVFFINDIIPLIISLPFTLYIFFLIKINFEVNINISYLFILIIFNLLIFRKAADYFYNALIENNTIQR